MMRGKKGDAAGTQFICLSYPDLTTGPNKDAIVGDAGEAKRAKRGRE